MSAPRIAAAARRQSIVTAVCLLLLSAIVLARIVLPALQDERFGIATTASGGGWSSDFVGILTFVRALWSGEAGYDVASHLRVTSERVGRTVDFALPFGYPPTILWLLGPFCLLPDAWSFAAWSIAGLLAIGWILRGDPSPWSAAACLSPLVFSCFSLGQTALLTTAAILFLARRDLEEPHDTRFAVSSTAVLFALSAKPPLLVTAISALLMACRSGIVLAAAVLIAGSLLMLAPVIGVHWIPDYLRIITHYDLETAHPAFTNAIAPHTMNNLRALLHVSFGAGDAIASRVSGALWLGSLACAALLGRRSRLSRQGRWILPVFSYLLFFPHLTSTEDLLLLAVLTPALQPTGSRLATVALTLAVLYLAAGLVIPDAQRTAVVFLLKLLLAIVCLRASVSIAQSPRIEEDPIGKSYALTRRA